MKVREEPPLNIVHRLRPLKLSPNRKGFAAGKRLVSVIDSMFSLSIRERALKFGGRISSSAEGIISLNVTYTCGDTHASVEVLPSGFRSLSGRGTPIRESIFGDPRACCRT